MDAKRFIGNVQERALISDIEHGLREKRYVEVELLFEDYGLVERNLTALAYKILEESRRRSCR